MNFESFEANAGTSPEEEAGEVEVQPERQHVERTPTIKRLGRQFVTTLALLGALVAAEGSQAAEAPRRPAGDSGQPEKLDEQALRKQEIMEVADSLAREYPALFEYSRYIPEVKAHEVIVHYKDATGHMVSARIGIPDFNENPEYFLRSFTDRLLNPEGEFTEANLEAALTPAAWDYCKQFDVQIKENSMTLGKMGYDLGGKPGVVIKMFEVKSYSFEVNGDTMNVRLVNNDGSEETVSLVRGTILR